MCTGRFGFPTPRWPGAPEVQGCKGLGAFWKSEGLAVGRVITKAKKTNTHQRWSSVLLAKYTTERSENILLWQWLSRALKQMIFSVKLPVLVWWNKEKNCCLSGKGIVTVNGNMGVNDLLYSLSVSDVHQRVTSIPPQHSRLPRLQGTYNSAALNTKLKIWKWKPWWTGLVFLNPCWPLCQGFIHLIIICF